MKNKIYQDASGTISSKLKYLIFNLHDTNISNFLRFLGYWKKYGYQKHVKFASGVRLEVFRQNHPDQDVKYTEKDYFVRAVYDDTEIEFDFCKDFYCTFEEFENHVNKNLMSDLDEAERFCKSKP